MRGKEWEGEAVAGGKHHQINVVLHGAVVKHHAGTLELFDVGLHLHRAREDTVGQLVVQSGVLTVEP